MVKFVEQSSWSSPKHPLSVMSCHHFLLCGTSFNEHETTFPSLFITLTSFFFLCRTLLMRSRPPFSSFFITLVPCHHFLLMCAILFNEIESLKPYDSPTGAGHPSGMVGRPPQVLVCSLYTLRAFFLWSHPSVFYFLLNQAVAKPSKITRFRRRSSSTRH